jgi:hypothetical protein
VIRTTTCLLSLGLALASPGTALAHDGHVAPLARAAAAPAAPSLTSENVQLIAGIPETAAISMEFARTGAFAYVSSTDTISVLDLTDPRDPVLRGTLIDTGRAPSAGRS